MSPTCIDYQYFSYGFPMPAAGGEALRMLFVLFYELLWGGFVVVKNSKDACRHQGSPQLRAHRQLPSSAEGK